MPLVSILTPAFHAAATLARAVASVQAQTVGDWEMLIVADDGADYRALLAGQGLADSGLRFLTTGRSGAGPGLARNLALAAARGEFIAALDADDLFYPTRLERLLPLAAADGMAGDNALVVDDPTGRPLGTVLPGGTGVLHLGLDDFADSLLPLTFLLRRRSVPAPWDADVRFGEDALFHLRALERFGPAPVYLQPLHEYRLRPMSLCHAPDTVEQAEQAYQHCLERLAHDGLGMQTEAGRAAARHMLEHKRAANRNYRAARAAGRCESYEAYLATQGRLYPLLPASACGLAA